MGGTGGMCSLRVACPFMRPGKVYDNETGDVADDSYNKVHPPVASFRVAAATCQGAGLPLVAAHPATLPPAGVAGACCNCARAPQSCIQCPAHLVCGAACRRARFLCLHLFRPPPLLYPRLLRPSATPTAQWKTDIQLIQNMKGLNAFRFSIAWSRIINLDGSVNQLGVAHYSSLIDGLLAANIDPWVTLYHWDLPVQFSTYNDSTHGWLNARCEAVRGAGGGGRQVFDVAVPA
jgi:hypothetical protein